MATLDDNAAQVPGAALRGHGDDPAPRRLAAFDDRLGRHRHGRGAASTRRPAARRRSTSARTRASRCSWSTRRTRTAGSPSAAPRSSTTEGADEQIDKLAKKYLGKDEYPWRKPEEQRDQGADPARSRRSQRLRRIALGAHALRRRPARRPPERGRGAGAGGAGGARQPARRRGPAARRGGQLRARRPRAADGGRRGGRRRDRAARGHRVLGPRAQRAGLRALRRCRARPRQRTLGATESSTGATATRRSRGGRAQVERILAAAQEPATVTISVAFGCPFEGEVDPGAVADAGRAFRAAGGRPRRHDRRRRAARGARR